MLPAPFAYVVAGTMLVVCGLAALTLIKIVESFDGHNESFDGRNRGIESKPEKGADAAGSQSRALPRSAEPVDATAQSA